MPGKSKDTARREAGYRDGDQVLIAQRPQGSVTRQLFLGQGLDTDHISASYQDGVLTLTIPVAEEARPHKVAITPGGGQAIEAGTTASR